MKKVLSILILLAFALNVGAFYYVQAQSIINPDIELNTSAEEEHHESVQKIDKIYARCWHDMMSMKGIIVLSTDLDYNLYGKSYAYTYISTRVHPPD